MNNLLLLLKIEMLSNLKYNELKNGSIKDKFRIISTALFMFICTVYLFIDILRGCFYLSDFLMETNQMELLLVIGLISGSFSTFIASLCKASSYIFKAKDNDLVGSLPIKHSTILSSRLLILLLSNYFFTYTFILATSIAYFIKMKTSLLYIALLIPLILMVPIIPTLVSSLIIFLISNISFKSKNKNLISILLNILIVVTFIIISINIRNIGMELVDNSELVILFTKKIYPLTYYFVDTLVNENLSSLFIFASISIIPTILFITVFSNNFNKIISRLNDNHTYNNYIVKKLKVSNPLKAIFLKDLNIFLSSTVYVINSSISMILLLMFSLSIKFMGYENIATILEINPNIDTVKSEIIGIIAFCIMTSNTSCVSISIEGGNLWLLKSLPIKERFIFRSKILLNLLLTIPISTISFLIIAITLNFEIETIILSVILIILLAIFSAMLGLFINLLYPKLNFKSEAQVIKQSASGIINTICSILYIAIVCGIGYILKGNNLNEILIVSNIITFINSLVLNVLLRYKGVKLFKNLSS